MTNTVEVKKRKENHVRAVVFKAENTQGQAPSKSIQDPWESITIERSQGIISPPFDSIGLIDIYEMSSELQSNVDAMKTNIPGFGWRLKRLGHTLPKQGEEPDPLLELHAQQEKQHLESFLTYIDYDDRSFTKLRGAYREELEVTGNAYLEVIEDLSGQVANWRNLPAFTMRTTLVDPEVVVAKQVQRIVRNGHSVIRIVPKQRRFRKYVQAKINGPFGITHHSTTADASLVWFKEYGDPRTMDWRTGEFVEPGTIEKRYEATSVIHMRNETSRSPYGIPRWIGALVPLLGVRSAEEINFSTFNNNNIPNLAILVSGGQLTEGSIDRITQFVESNIQGDDNYSKILLLEAEGIEDDMGDMANVRMEIKPLSDTQHTDALFVEYDQRSREKIRQSFRLPPIYVGRAEDYTRACYDAETQTLTENGWRFYWEIEQGERIATFNPQTNQLEYHEPVGGIYLYDYDGPMRHYQNRNTDVMVTPDHKMWARPYSNKDGWQKLPAEEIAWSRFMFRSSPDSTKHDIILDDYVTLPPVELKGGPNAGVRPEIQIPMALWVRFVAAFVADGSTTPEFVKGKRRCMYNITLAASKPRKVEAFARLADAMRSVGLNVFERCEQADGMIAFVLADKGLWQLLRQECGTRASNKRLPADFQHLPEGLAGLALEMLQNTDGTTDKRKGRTSWSYSTNSEELADQVQILAMQQGHRAKKILTEKTGNYRVLVVPGKREHEVNQTQVSEPWYTGKVYCYEVPNHLFVTRRNGCVTIQGNTADVSRRIADEQIFNPERIEEDFFLNRFLLSEFEMLYHEFVTNTPNITNDEDLVRVMAGAEKTGGMTPRVAHAMLEDLMGRELPPPQGIDLDVPMSLQMAEAVKNQADPSEPGQQVTALKREIRARVERAMQLGATADDVLAELIEAGATVGLTAKDVFAALGVYDG